MGGPNSGYRRTRPGKKVAAERCITINADDLAQRGHIADGEVRSGESTWVFLCTGARCRVRHEADARARQALLLSWAWSGDRPGGPEAGVCLSPLSTTAPPFGGVRWWLQCPVEGCGRRVGRLYLPPDKDAFGCRTCHGLSYRSRQEARARARAARLGDMESLDTFRDFIDAARWIVLETPRFVCIRDSACLEDLLA